MDSHSKVIPLHLHPMGFIEAFTQLGANLDALLRDTGIQKRMFDNKDAKISYAQQRKLILNGIELCDEPGLGLLVGQHYDWSYHGTVGSVVHCAPSLQDAGEAFLRFIAIARPHYALHPRRPSVYVDENNLLIYPLRSLRSNGDDRQLWSFKTEFRLAVALRLWDLCGNKSVPDPAVRVCLEYPEPAHANLYRELPCTTLQFGCEQSHIAANTKFVVEPFRPLRRHAFDCIIAQCEEELRKANLETSYTTRVRWHVYSHFNKLVSLEKVAEILHVTPRTLTRRLAAEKTTFRKIVHDVRMELTSHHLRSSKLSIDEIAELMGFSCVSSLRRAIRNWTGEPVSTVRAHASTVRPMLAVAAAWLIAGCFV